MQNPLAIGRARQGLPVSTVPRQPCVMLSAGGASGWPVFPELGTDLEELAVAPAEGLLLMWLEDMNLFSSR
jgi:hypothetical protein